MTDLLSTLPPPEPKPGVSNGKALGLIHDLRARGASLEAIKVKMRDHVRRGDLVGYNPAIAIAEFNHIGGK